MWSNFASKAAKVVLKSPEILALWSSLKLAMLATQALLHAAKESPSVFLVVFPDFDIVPTYIKLMPYTCIP